MTNSIGIIDHIHRDLGMLSGLVTQKHKEAIFVNIHSKDKRILTKCEKAVRSPLQKKFGKKMVFLKNPAEAKAYLEGKQEIQIVDKTEDCQIEALSVMPIFESMTSELLLLNRYRFLIQWYKKYKFLIANPLTLLLLNKWRLGIHILWLICTNIAFSVLPTNSMFTYFIGENSPIFMLIWIPYLLRLAYDIKYLGRLNLLMSELALRLNAEEKPRETKKENIQVQEIIFISSTMNDMNCIESIYNNSVHKNMNIIHFSHEKMDQDSFQTDIAYCIPGAKERETIHIIDGLSNNLNHRDYSIEPNIQKIFPLEKEDIQKFDHLKVLMEGSIDTCWRVISNYAHLKSCYLLRDKECTALALLMILRHMNVEVWEEVDKEIVAEKHSFKSGHENGQSAYLKPLIDRLSIEGLKMDSVVNVYQKIQGYMA